VGGDGVRDLVLWRAVKGGAGSGEKQGAVPVFARPASDLRQKKRKREKKPGREGGRTEARKEDFAKLTGPSPGPRGFKPREEN